MIFYEAPHRLRETLRLMADAAGARPAAAVREVSKKFEQVQYMTLAALAQYYEEQEPRGEYVIVIEGKSREQLARDARSRFEDLSLEEHMALYQDRPEKEAMKAVAKDRGISKREVYAALKRES